MARGKTGHLTKAESRQASNAFGEVRLYAVLYTHRRRVAMRPLASSETLATGGLDSRLIATMRLVLSSSVLFSIGPSEIDLSLEAFQIPSALYTVYSAV